MGFLSIDPEELIFENVKLGHAYTQRIVIRNPHDAPVTVTLKSSASSRYQISPAGDIVLPACGYDLFKIFIGSSSVKESIFSSILLFSVGF